MAYKLQGTGLNKQYFSQTQEKTRYTNTFTQYTQQFKKLSATKISKLKKEERLPSDHINNAPDDIERTSLLRY